MLTHGILVWSWAVNVSSELMLVSYGKTNFSQPQTKCFHSWPCLEMGVNCWECGKLWHCLLLVSNSSGSLPCKKEGLNITNWCYLGCTERFRLTVGFVSIPWAPWGGNTHVPNLSLAFGVTGREGASFTLFLLQTPSWGLEGFGSLALSAAHPSSPHVHTNTPACAYSTREFFPSLWGIEGKKKRANFFTGNKSHFRES